MKLMERTDALKKYLKNKHQGGENNQKGGLFEDFYAVYQIVSCIAKYKSSFDRVEFQTQLEDTFVDDLLIAHPDENMYHQLKNTQSLSWGKVDIQGNIAFDFAHQIEDCKQRNEKFALKLVYSLKDSKVQEQIPEAIKDQTLTEYFDYSSDLNSLVLISTPLKHALIEITPNGDKTPTDDLANIASVFLGIWKGCDSKNKISLSEIIHRAENFKQVNLKIYPNKKINEGCKKVLDAIDGFKYYISGRMFYWNIGRMNGSCPWSDVIETEIINQHPTDKWKLISILS